MSVTITQEANRPHVAHLRIDVNDLNLLTVDEVEDISRTINEVPDEVAVLTIAANQSEIPEGDIRGLTAGLNLEWAKDLSPHEGQDLLRSIYELTQAVRDLEAVTICSCGDYTLGAGFELAMGCEFRIATANATLGLPETKVGLPTVIHGGLLIRLAGEQVANELIYTGTTVTGTQAKELAIVNRAVTSDDYGKVMDELVDNLAAKSPLVMKLQKRVMQRYRSQGLEAGIKASIADVARCFGTDDQHEAMTAFLEDRNPEFSD